MGFIAIAVLFWIFGSITEDVIEKERFAFDSHFLAQVEEIRTPRLTRIVVFITDLGGDYVIGSGTAVTILVLAALRQWLWVRFFMWVMAGGTVLDLILNISIQRARPPGPGLIEAQGWSYPCGHAMASTLFYFALVYFMLDKTRPLSLRLFNSVLAFCLVLLIAFSRVYLGVHYPSDVLAGFIGGLIWLTLCVFVMELSKRKKGKVQRK